MNEFDYDAMQKKRVARSAFAHVRFKRGGCTLPHELMTEEERNAMNGDVKTYNINRPVKWAEYKALPDDLKREYWRNMQGCGGTAVWLRDYMGVSDVSIINAARAAGVPFRRGGGDSTLGASCEARWNTADAVEITRGVNESHTEGAESAQERTEDSGECSKYPPRRKARGGA